MQRAYIWQIAFQGNGNCSFGYYTRPENAFQKRADAVAAAHRADGCGLAYGAFAKRLTVLPEVKAKARQGGP